MDKTKNSVLKSLWSRFNYVIIFLAIFIVYLIINGSATTWTGVMNILYHSAVLGTIAIGMGLIILTGDFDLSVGSTFVLAGGFAVWTFNATNSILLTLIVGVILGGILGAFNGLMIGRLKMPSFIVTLATMLIYRSVSQFIMNNAGETRYQIDATLGSYPTLFGIGNGNIITIPFIGIIFLVIALLAVYITTSTKFGKQLYAIGSNSKAAALAGINVEWKKVLVYAICGLLVGVSCFLKICKDMSFDPASSGKSYEMYAIASVVIGGLSMSGGRGKMAGIIFGTLSFTVIDKIITAMGLNALLNDAVKGAILLIAIALQTIKKRSK